MKPVAHYLRYPLFLGLVLSVFSFNPFSAEPFLFYKEMTWRLVVTLCVLGYTVLRLIQRQSILPDRRLFLASLPLWLFLLYTVTSYGVALNTHEVREEQLRLIYLVVFFLMISAVAWETFDFKVFFWFVSLTGVVVSVFGILEDAGIYLMFHQPNNILSLFGYRNLVAQFIMYALFCEVALMFLLRRRAWQIINGLAYAANFCCLFLTTCRSVWLGLVSAVFILIAVGLIKKWIAARVFLGTFFLWTLCGVAGSAILFMRDYRVTAREAVHEIAPDAGVSQQADTEANSLISDRAVKETRAFGYVERGEGSRLRWWKTTLRMLKDHTVFGVGLGNFYVVFPKYQIYPDHVVFIQWAHNDFLQLLSELGILGFGFALIWILTITWRAIRIARNEAMTEKGICYATFIVILWAIGVDAFFSYEWYLTVPSIMIWTVWGFFQSAYIHQQPDRELIDSRIISTPLLKNILTAFFVGVLIFASFQNIFKKCLAHHYFSVSQRYDTEGKLGEAKPWAEKAVALDPYVARYRYALAVVLSGLGEWAPALEELYSTKLLTPFSYYTNIAIAKIKTAVGDYSGALDILNGLAQAYPEDSYPRRLHYEALQSKAERLMDGGQLEDARMTYEYLAEENPNFKVFCGLASVEQLRGDDGRAVYYYKRALTFESGGNSTTAQAHLNLALLLMERAPADARTHLKESLRLSPEQPQRDAIEENIQYLEALIPSK